MANEAKTDLRPEAQDEFKEGISEYKKIQKGLARRFDAEVKKHLKLLQKMPNIHGVVVDDVRRAVVNGFPYVVYYRVTDLEIIIISIFHTSRDPGIWQARV